MATIRVSIYSQDGLQYTADVRDTDTIRHILQERGVEFPWGYVFATACKVCGDDLDKQLRHLHDVTYGTHGVTKIMIHVIPPCGYYGDRLHRGIQYVFAPGRYYTKLKPALCHMCRHKKLLKIRSEPLQYKLYGVEARWRATVRTIRDVLHNTYGYVVIALPRNTKKPLFAREHEIDELKRRFSSSDIITVKVGESSRTIYPTEESWDSFVSILQEARYDAAKLQCSVTVFARRNDWPAGVCYLIAYLNRWYKYDLIV